MNGSTINNGVVGFNPDAASKAIVGLDDSYRAYKQLLDRSLGWLANLLFDEGGDKEGFGSLAHDAAWYSPEAVNFDRLVLEPSYYNFSNNMTKIYSDVYIKIQAAIVDWGMATGQHIPIRDSIAKGGELVYTHAKAQDKNGNIRINPDLAASVLKYKNEALEHFDEQIDTILYLLKKSDAFLGAGQQAALMARVNKSLYTIRTQLVEVYDKAYSEVQKSIEKYQAIAKQIAANFNSGVVESATASVNNG